MSHSHPSMPTVGLPTGPLRPAFVLPLVLSSLLPVFLGSACARTSQSHHPERIPLGKRACWDPPTCFEVLERSSDPEAQQFAEEQMEGFGPPAIPRLSWLLRYGDLASQRRASGALGRLAGAHPDEVLAAAGAELRERCADNAWTSCWALANARDRSQYPLLAEHMKDGRPPFTLFDRRGVPADFAEWLIGEIEDRDASADVHTGVLSMLQDAKGELSLAALERVRKLIEAELPPDLSHVPSGDRCMETNEGCWPRIDYLVAAIAAWGPRGLAARREVRAVWRSTPPPHKFMARSALAEIGDRAIVPSLLGELSPLRPRTLRDFRLLGRVARPELPKLIALFERAPGSERAALFVTILAIGGEQAVSVAVDALDNPIDDEFAALEMLLEASQEHGVDVDRARRAKTRIEALATRSSERLVRERASELLVALGFDPPRIEAWLPCPPVLGAERPRRPEQMKPRARLATGTVVFDLVSAAQQASGCAPGATPSVRVENECLRGHSRGEFGFAISVHDAQSDQARGTVRGVALNPERFVVSGKDLLVIEGLSHFVFRGNIDHLVRASDGSWEAHGFAALPGLPVGYSVDPSGRLLVLVREDRAGLCERENGGWQVLRIGENGGSEALPGPDP